MLESLISEKIQYAFLSNMVQSILGILCSIQGKHDFKLNRFTRDWKMYVRSNNARHEDIPLEKKNTCRKVKEMFLLPVFAFVFISQTRSCHVIRLVSESLSCPGFQQC